MATAEQVLALLSSHASGDESRFASVAMQIAAGEAQKGRRDLAEEIKRLIDEARKVKHEAPVGAAVHVATPQGELVALLAISHPETRLSHMVLESELARRLHRVLKEQRQLEALRSHALHPRRKILLMGPPGSGKTMSAAALAGELALPLCVVRLESLLTKYMGETTAKLRLVFDAVERTRAVYLFDEFDSLGYERSVGHDVGEMRRVLNSFLVFLENVRGQSLIVAATNHGAMLDPALFRRFDDVLEFRLPHMRQRTEAFVRRLAAFATPKSMITTIARESAGLSYGEIGRVCDDAIKDVLLSERRAVSLDDLRKVLKERRPAVRRPKGPRRAAP